MLNNLFFKVKNEKHPAFLEYPKGICKVTRKVIDAYNTLSEHEFMIRYQCSKSVYAKRVKRYGDPYMKAPLARFGKFLIKMGL